MFPPPGFRPVGFLALVFALVFALGVLPFCGQRDLCGFCVGLLVVFCIGFPIYVGHPAPGREASPGTSRLPT